MAPEQPRLAPILWLALVAALLVAAPTLVAQTGPFEGLARGFPVLRDPAGNKLGDGDFAQWVDGDRLHVRSSYSLGRGARIEESAVFRQRPTLVQEAWSFREQRNGELYRQFEVNFQSRTASARKREKDGLEQWSEQIEVVPGRTFAGFGFTLAIKAFRKQLLDGETIELKAVGFMPKPRVASVALSHGGVDEIRMGDRTLKGDRFIIHPKVPWYAKPFVKIEDTHVWLATPPPAGFLRSEGPLAEPSDDTVRVELFPGAPSRPAARQDR